MWAGVYVGGTGVGVGRGHLPLFIICGNIMLALNIHSIRRDGHKGWAEGGVVHILMIFSCFQTDGLVSAGQWGLDYTKHCGNILCIDVVHCI